MPFIGIVFFLALKKVRELFKKGQEAIDWLNRVINESILGATLISLLNSQQVEYQKFVSANAESKNIGLNILGIMSALIPTITLAANAATVVILLVGGRFVIAGRMTLGDFSAFNTYLALLIFPIILLGFMSNVMAQAGASYYAAERRIDGPAAAESRRASFRVARRHRHERHFAQVRGQGSTQRMCPFPRKAAAPRPLLVPPRRARHRCCTS